MEMSFLLHLLQSADTFWDLGANIGSYTILAGKISNAHVLSVEPLPRTFHYLKKNIHINSIEDKVISLNIGLSDKPGELFFTQHHDTVNHVTNPNNSNALRVSVETCNNLLAKSLHCPILMKIDVEGFEFPVLKGADQVLNNPILKAIILELNGLGAKYGYKDEEIDKFLRKFGFQPYTYYPFQRKLEQIDWPFKSANILYLRDVALVRERIKNGMEIHAGGYIY
ncbi:MAG: FkbM family methyltransferase [Cyclobacteriaceae bacterium]|nr:FkbM family methyltransferase [Cyclobacteriaceae bacterium]